LAGNHRDDDGEAIQQYFEPPSQGPETHLGLEPIVDVLPVPTRIINVKVALGADPVPALTVDINRVNLNIVCKEAPFIVASDKTECYFAPSIPLNVLLTMNGHTGAVWIHTLVEADFGKIVTVSAVTS
jgi:hypothetical protein